MQPEIKETSKEDPIQEGEGCFQPATPSQKRLSMTTSRFSKVSPMITSVSARPIVVQAKTIPNPTPKAPEVNVERFEDEKVQLRGPCCRVSLGVILFAQTAIVIASFAILISVVTFKITQTKKNLVEAHLRDDFQFSKSSIVDPLLAAEKLILAQRLRYISASEDRGRPLCSEQSNEFIDSKEFYREAISTLSTHEDTISFVYVLHRSNNISNVSSGALATFECGATSSYIYGRTSTGSRSSNSAVTMTDVVSNFAGVASTVDNVTDFSQEGYFSRGLSYTDFGWVPYVWIESVTFKEYLLIGGYAPMYMNRTLSDGTVETFVPDLSERKELKFDPQFTVVSAIAADINIDHVKSILRSITPAVEGAHTTLYDHEREFLLSTTADIPLLSPSQEMWKSGHTCLEELNEAYRTVNGLKHSEDVGEMTTVKYRQKDILSSFHISTASDIDFVIIQSTPIEYYLGTVYTLRTLMIVLGVCAAVIVVTVCVGVALVISRKIAEIEGGMLLAAVLKNDQVQPCRSFIGEMDSLCVAFARMNAKLGAARAFMPQSMLVSDESGNEDEGDNATEIQTVQDPSLRNSNPSGSLRKSQLMEDSVLMAATTAASTFDSPTVTTKDSKERPPIKNAFQSSGLQSKRVTMLCVNTLGFHRNIGDVFALNSVAADLTTHILETAAAHRGVIDSFHGDHYVLSFNAAKHNAQGPQSAARCGLDIMAALGPKVAFSMGVAAGRALVGHLGSTEMKRFSIVGKVYSQAVALERVCKQVSGEGGKGGYGVPQLVTDLSIVPDIEHFHFLQVLGCSLGIESTVIYGIAGGTVSKTAKNEEWLYEVMNSDSANGTFDALLPAVNEAMEALLGPGTVLENMPRFGAAVGAAAEVAARSPALVGREWGQQALLRAMTVLRAVSPETVSRFIHFAI